MKSNAQRRRSNLVASSSATASSATNRRKQHCFNDCSSFSHVCRGVIMFFLTCAGIVMMSSNRPDLTATTTSSSSTTTTELNTETSPTTTTSRTNDNGVGGGDTDRRHYTMFLGRKMCHPGYAPPLCEELMEPLNPYYTKDCRNLDPEHLKQNTLWPLGEPIDDDGGIKANLTMSDLGGRYGCEPELDSMKQPWVCSYLCYSHQDYGVTIVPQTVWRIAQEAEGTLWKMAGRRNHDRAPEHVGAFGSYKGLSGRSLGDMIEVGSGPWTQSRFLLQAAPDVEPTVTSFTVYEPGAEYYINNVVGCAYKNRKSLLSADKQRFHAFPLHIIGTGGESLLDHPKMYDTLVSINVIEHVQNAYSFLEGLHRVIKPGGLLVFHERYYEKPMDGDCVLGVNFFHPIRITKNVLDAFLELFDVVYLSTDQTPRMKQSRCNETPIYFIGTKK